jgi:hypothetical protein
MELWNFCLSATGTDDTRAPLFPNPASGSRWMFQFQPDCRLKQQAGRRRCRVDTHLHTQRLVTVPVRNHRQSKESRTAWVRKISRHGCDRANRSSCFCLSRFAFGYELQQHLGCSNSGNAIAWLEFTVSGPVAGKLRNDDHRTSLIEAEASVVNNLCVTGSPRPAGRVR